MLNKNKYIVNIVRIQIKAYFNAIFLSTPISVGETTFFFFFIIDVL